MTNVTQKYGIRATAEFRRIRDLPRRKITDPWSASVASQLTSVLRTPTGTQALRPVQGASLHDIAVCRGLLGPIGVGRGKTLISLLAPVVLEAKRPLLLLPAALIEKTERERRELSKHWRIPRTIQLLSYEMLSRVQSQHFLNLHRPDVIILDEAHKVKNKRAGVTRRLTRFMKEHPETIVIAMSGTIMKGGIEDFAHLAHWALKDRSPLPIEHGELEEWSRALDGDTSAWNRLDPGALLSFATEEERATLAPEVAARRGFQRRLLETPGVVASLGDSVEASLYVRSLDYEVNATTEENYRILRTEMKTPCGWALSEAVQEWRHARELALGMHYIWDPRPPEEWLTRRSNWASFVRQVLGSSRTLDTELQVKQAVENGELSSAYQDLGAEILRAWQLIEKTFTVRPKAIWHDDGALKACEQWAAKNHGIIWVEHTFFGHELAKRTGLSYYGAQGLDESGRPIEQADPKKALIASIAANSTGRNLQAWSRNLVTSSPASATTWEQMLGRTHREGQQADTVEVDVLLGCVEHDSCFQNAINGARLIQDTTGHQQKILLADVTWDGVSTKPNSHGGYRWQKSSRSSDGKELQRIWNELDQLD
jgi:hypothetical protein